jgi:hemoglobin
MASPQPVPTIYEWAGGHDAFARWLNAFYDLVEDDELLAPLFGGIVSVEHREHVSD